MIKHIHSYFAFFVLGIVLYAVLRFGYRFISKKEYAPKDFQIALLTLIFSHTQLLIGLILYFISPRFSSWFELSLLEIINSPLSRLYLIEHPLVNILAIIIITRGYGRHKRRRVSTPKFKIIFAHYLIALVLLLSRIPWEIWINI